MRCSQWKNGVQTCALDDGSQVLEATLTHKGGGVYRMCVKRMAGGHPVKKCAVYGVAARRRPEDERDRVKCCLMVDVVGAER